MAAGDLTDLATVKAWLGGSGGASIGTTSDTQLEGLISAASMFVNSYLNRTLLSASYSEFYDGNGQSFMPLRQAPVTAITDVEWSGTKLVAADPLALSSGYLIDADARTLRLIGYRFPWRIPVKVAYTAGYVTAPLDVAQACVELVGSAFKRRDHIDQTTKSLGGSETVGFSQADMNATIKALLANYRFVSPPV